MSRGLLLKQAPHTFSYDSVQKTPALWQIREAAVRNFFHCTQSAGLLVCR